MKCFRGEEIIILSYRELRRSTCCQTWNSLQQLCLCRSRGCSRHRCNIWGPPLWEETTTKKELWRRMFLDLSINKEETKSSQQAHMSDCIKFHLCQTSECCYHKVHIQTVFFFITFQGERWLQIHYLKSELNPGCDSHASNRNGTHTYSWAAYRQPQFIFAKILSCLQVSSSNQPLSSSSWLPITCAAHNI